MNRTGWIVAIVAGVAIGGGWYLFQSRGEPQSPDAPVATAKPEVASAAPATAYAEVGTAVDAVPAAQVDRWINEVNDADATRRATAIAALARAPREQALPVLHRVLINGEPTVDRGLALQSLRELALGQGDADGKVRGAIREAMYHGDGTDETLTVAAQDALDVVEESELR